MKSLYYPESPIENRTPLADDTYSSNLESRPFLGEELIQMINTLAEQLLSVEDCFTVGILGPWGSGKSTFGCKLLEVIKNLDEESRPVTIHFNVSQFDHEPNPMLPLLSTIHAAIENRPDIEDIKHSISALLYGLSIKLPYVKLETKRAIDREEKLLKGVFLDVDNQTIFSRALNALGIHMSKGPRMYIFIDDLDRTEPERALSLLHQIKNVFDLPNCIFIIAINYEIISDFARKKYIEIYGAENFTVESYVSKLIQLPIFLPESSPFCRELIETISKTRRTHPSISVQTHALKGYWGTDRYYDLISEVSSSNPRFSIRLLNRIFFVLSVSAPTLDVVRFEKLVIFEALAMHAPKLTHQLRHQVIVRDFFGMIRPRESELRDVLESLGIQRFQINTVIRLLHLQEEHELFDDLELFSHPAYQAVEPDTDFQPFFLHPSQCERPERRSQILELVDEYNHQSIKNKAPESENTKRSLLALLEGMHYLNHSEGSTLLCFKVLEKNLHFYSRRVRDSFLRTLDDEMIKDFDFLCRLLGHCNALCTSFEQAHTDPLIRLRFSSKKLDLDMLLFDVNRKDDGLLTAKIVHGFHNEIEAHIVRLQKFLVSEIYETPDFLDYLRKIIICLDGVESDFDAIKARLIAIKNSLYKDKEELKIFLEDDVRSDGSEDGEQRVISLDDI